MGTNDDIRIELKGRNVTIPKALPETIKRMYELISLRDEMIRRAEKERDNYDPDDSMCSVWDCYREMYNIVEQYNERYELKLKSEYGVLVFASFSEYMKKYYDVCKSAEQRVVALYKYQIASREVGSKFAEQEALREIKGMPFGIITNSISSVLIYNGMAAINRASQVKKAEQTYNRLMAKYDRNEAGYGEMRIVTEEIFPLIYPVAEKTAAIFLNDVLRTIDGYQDIGYASLLDEHKTCKLVSDDKYAYGDTIALRKALNALSEISDSKEEYEKVMDVLQECPYCPEVYFKLIRMGMFDVNIFEIAKILHIEKLVLPEIEKEIEKRKGQIVELRPLLDIVAIYKNQSYEQVLKKTFQSTISKIKNDYREMSYLCVDSMRLERWIIDNIDSDMDKVVVSKEDAVRTIVAFWIQKNIDDSQFSELASMGLMSIEEIRMKDSTMTTLEDVRSEYLNMMISRIMEYIKEANMRKVAYKEAYEKFDAGVKELSEAIATKADELKQQGMFAFAKKKKIKAELDRLHRELNEFRQKEPVGLMKAYYRS